MRLQIGACGKSLRVEHCEKTNVVAAAARVTIAHCTDSTFNIASNTAPLLAGDNRFVQLAPFNTAYKHLARHLKEAGVARQPVHWSDPLELSRDPYQVCTPHAQGFVSSDAPPMHRGSCRLVHPACARRGVRQHVGQAAAGAGQQRG